jgi:hypothetical protein
MALIALVALVGANGGRGAWGGVGGVAQCGSCLRHHHGWGHVLNQCKYCNEVQGSSKIAGQQHKS